MNDVDYNDFESVCDAIMTDNPYLPPAEVEARALEEMHAYQREQRRTCVQGELDV